MKFITITVGVQRITSKQAIKYLGVVVDNRLTFREHLMYIGVKCVAPSCAFVRIMPNQTGGKTVTAEVSDIDCNICSPYMGPTEDPLSSLFLPFARCQRMHQC